jgi:hypothetical protein
MSAQQLFELSSQSEIDDGARQRTATHGNASGIRYAQLSWLVRYQGSARQCTPPQHTPSQARSNARQCRRRTEHGKASSYCYARQRTATHGNARLLVSFRLTSNHLAQSKLTNPGRKTPGPQRRVSATGETSPKANPNPASATLRLECSIPGEDSWDRDRSGPLPTNRQYSPTPTILLAYLCLPFLPYLPLFSYIKCLWKIQTLD